MDFTPIKVVMMMMMMVVIVEKMNVRDELQSKEKGQKGFED